MIILGVILLLIAYFAPLPYPIDELLLVGGWILLVVGIVLWALYLADRPIGRGVRGRRGVWF